MFSVFAELTGSSYILIVNLSKKVNMGIFQDSNVQWPNKQQILPKDSSDENIQRLHNKNIY